MRESQRRSSSAVGEASGPSSALIFTHSPWRRISTSKPPASPLLVGPALVWLTSRCSIRRSSDSSPNTSVPAPGSIGDARVRCHVAEKSGQIDAPASGFAGGAELQLAEAPDGVIQGVQGGFHLRRLLDHDLASGRRLGQRRNPLSQRFGGAASFLGQEPRKLLARQTFVGHERKR